MSEAFVVGGVVFGLPLLLIFLHNTRHSRDQRWLEETEPEMMAQYKSILRARPAPPEPTEEMAP